jgi:hypothetical protein|tara:strand:+ start:472 stop:741 length:270 start_codon:yes stop_codon:yes gene_type:complete
MEIIKNRYGDDRVIEKISPTKLRITGESEFTRGSENAEGNQTMFDFEGGPCLNIGGKIKYMKSDWTIISIEQDSVRVPNLASVIIEVKL